MVQPNDSPPWVPVDEPLKATLLRTGTIALVLGTVLFVVSKHRVSWPVAVLVALWPSFGGHWVELWFLNWLRPRLATARPVQVLARLAVWTVGGIALALMMRLTATALDGPEITWRTVLLGGMAFLAIELVVHGALAARKQRSFFNGLG